jgi:hypothetical protein
MAVDLIGDGLPLRSKGDIVSHDGTSLIIQSVGTDGQILVAQSSATNGMIWTTPDTSASGGETPIAYTAVTTDTSSVVFSGIPGTYSSLRLVCLAKTDRASNTPDNIVIQFNSTTTSDYTYHFVLGRTDGTTIYPGSRQYGTTAFGSKNGSVIPRSCSTSNATNANYFGVSVVYISQYSNSSTYTWTQFHSGTIHRNNSTAGTNENNTSVGTTFYTVASTVTSIVLKPDHGTNFTSGTKFSLYGVV